MNELTDGELYDQAVSMGFQFSMMGEDDVMFRYPSLWITDEFSGLIREIDREIERRGERFMGFVEFKLVME